MSKFAAGLPASALKLPVIGQLLHAATQNPERWLRALNLALCAVLGLQLAWIVWLLVPEASTTMAPPAAPAGSGTAPAATVNIGRVVSLPIFGEQVITPASPPANAPSNAPETRLNLTLTGIFAASDKASARALIKDDKSEQHAYAIGDDVPGGASISAIHPDKVLLLRNGRYETLSLQATLAPSLATSGAGNITPPNGMSAATVAQLREARQEILSNPAKASDYFRLQPVYKSGKLQGYRIYPGRKRRLFTQIGLESGELVTSVNGTQLNDPVAGLAVLGQLAQTDRLTLTLERNGQTRTLNINLQ